MNWLALEWLAQKSKNWQQAAASWQQAAGCRVMMTMFIKLYCCFIDCLFACF